MSISASVKDMRTEAIALTVLGTRQSIVWEQVGNVVIEVLADAVQVEYYAKMDDKIFYTTNTSIFVNALSYILQ